MALWLLLIVGSVPVVLIGLFAVALAVAAGRADERDERALRLARSGVEDVLDEIEARVRRPVTRLRRSA